jgi:hypothetical protein
MGIQDRVTMDALKEWRIIERMMVGDFNENHDPKTGQFAKGSGGSSGYSVYVDADSEDDWIHANHKKGGEAWKQLQKIYDEGCSEAVTKEYYEFKTNKSTKDLDLIDDRTADEVLFDALGKNAYHGWFIEANSGYKPRIASAILSTPETRNAALSIMYKNYQELVGKDIDYKTWLNTPIKIYRGNHGKDRRETDVFVSYTFNKATAEKFRSGEGKLEELMIKPIDTWGSVSTNTESEIMVPFYNRKGKQ